MKKDSFSNKIINFLNEYSGQTNKEIAEAIGMAQDSVRYELYRLKKKGLIFGSNDKGWYTDEDLKKRMQRKKEIIEDILEECYELFKNSTNEKNKIQLARIITDLLKKF